MFECILNRVLKAKRELLRIASSLVAIEEAMEREKRINLKWWR